MDSRLKISGMTAIAVIIYWGWYYTIPTGCWGSCVSQPTILEMINKDGHEKALCPFYGLR